MILRKITVLMFLVVVFLLAYHFIVFKQKIMQDREASIIQNQQQQNLGHGNKFNNVREVAANEAKSN